MKMRFIATSVSAATFAVWFASVPIFFSRSNRRFYALHVRFPYISASFTLCRFSSFFVQFLQTQRMYFIAFWP